MRGRRFKTQADIDRYIANGCGQGDGTKYKPWLRVQDIPSQGRSRRVQGVKTGRLHEFLSELEFGYFLALEFSGFRGFRTNVAIDTLQRQETLDTYAAIAKQAGISERIAKAAVMQTVSLAKDLWPKALQDMDVPDAVRLEIEERLNKLPLARSTKP